ncbi:anthranilate synthase component I family protein [Flavivirga rizhaonensis]|uniref:Anthranilate synthase component I family protein n=1 Tax=Flavivirga rizhaonensis TaxID=2559571 RepID=A0A4S1DRS2_9FLAO|nr:anthranilate synthase component I family protein [Flavivirga rizhaonensis]TGV00413.1 anthranilate synthase component I family protein [Flavivirga rizhaonensis]
MRTTQIHRLDNVNQFKNQLLIWSQQFDDVIWLDSNNYEQNHSNFEAVLAVDAFTSVQTNFEGSFEMLKEYQTNVNDWIFGYLTYDLKNDVEDLSSSNFDSLQFPDLYFFQPKKLFLFKGDQVEIQYLKCVDDEFEDDLKEIQSKKTCHPEPFDCAQDELSRRVSNDIKVKLRIHKDEYFEKVNNMLAHIHRGDIYEANFCQEFYAENTSINPLDTYLKLNNISNPPFATFLKFGDKYLLSASPERYLKKDKETIISQPIKGTAKRSENTLEDEALKEALSKDTKERSENIMIVDLVRNDLSKTAIKGSVKVEELTKIYTFDQVHQMISTVTSKIKETTHAVDVIKSTFPMGSMTGVPKISAMRIIEALEETRRGLYSGSVGYFSPTSDFDFNVVIRSILYNKTKKYVSYSVGGAITAKSDPLKEYEECLVKAKAMRTVLEN